MPIHLLARSFLARPIFDPEDGDDTVLRNFGSFTEYTALIPEDGQCHKYRHENL
jgi:hypothetical protein